VSDTSQALPEIDGVRVDVPALAALRHRCDPALCRDSGSCCACHDLWIGDEEAERIRALRPEAARYAAHLKAAATENAGLKRLGPDWHTIVRRQDGLCSLAYRTEDGRVLCSLHSAAVRKGADPFRAKPECCVLWPLSLTTSNPPVLSVQEGAFEFPCNHRREPDGALHDGVANIIRVLFGREFYAALAAVATDQFGL
jgi:hypothetical protein